MKRLFKIQQELKAPKDLYNSYGGYKYRSAEGILEAVKPLLKETETILTITDEVVQLGDRFYVKAVATIYDAETNKEIHHCTAMAREPENKKGMDEAQITGSTSSYARKYALNALLCIDDVKDPDATNKHEKEQENFVCKQCGKEITEGAFKAWNGLCAECHRATKAGK